MPNWVAAGFNVTGDRAELARFKKLMIKTDETSAKGDLTLDFNGIIPMPPEEECADPEAWAVANWGTKWNAQSVDISADDPDLVWLQFLTAWDFPDPVFEALAREFPTLVFKGSAYEESGEFELVGQFNGGGTWGPGKIDWL